MSPLVRRLLLVAVSIGLAADARAAPAAPQIKDVALGFGGAYKVGYWTPVWITLAAGAESAEVRLEIVAPDGDGVRGAVVDERLTTLAAGSETTLLRYFKFGRVGSEIVVNLLGADGAVLATREFPAGRLTRAEPSTRELVLTVGREAGVKDTLADYNRQHGDDEHRVHARIADAALLPDRWFGYEGVDTVVFTTADPNTCDALSDRQIEALDRWVQLGGRLVFCAGSNGASLLGPEGRFARFAPGRFVEVRSESRTDGIEEYARGERIDTAQGAEDFRLRMSLLADVRGRVDAHESVVQNVPAVIRTAHGLGQVVFVAFDLDAPPISTWTGRPRLVARLLNPSLRRGEESPSRRSSGQVSHIGYREMTGQLRGALDQFSGVTPFAFSWIAGLIVGYILLIGPADYFFLRKLTGNMAWTWVTFPLVVVGCCVLAYFLSDAARGKRVKINQVELVDIDAESGAVRGTSWTHVYSPATRRFDLSLALDSTPGETAGALLSWQGLPGDAMGGMNTTMNAESAMRLFNQPYRISSSALPDSSGAAALAGVPIQVGSSKTLMGRWWGRSQTQRLDNLVERRDRGTLAGTFGNPLEVELRDCTLYYAGLAYVTDQNLSPGQTVSVAELPPPRTLEWHLTRRRIDKGVGPDRAATKGQHDVVTAWDQSGEGVPRILEVMMLYDAAAGYAYTGLSERYQGFVDLSAHLQLGRAVLLGRVERPAAELAEEGKPLSADYDRRWTWYRIVFPVGKEG